MTNKALSSEDIKQIFGGKINVYTYDELQRFNNIDEALSPYGRCIILYFWQTKPSTYGHWTAIFKLDNNDVEFYDSFSSKPDDNLKEINKTFRQKTEWNILY